MFYSMHIWETSRRSEGHRQVYFVDVSVDAAVMMGVEPALPLHFEIFPTDRWLRFAFPTKVKSCSLLGDRRLLHRNSAF